MNFSVLLSLYCKESPQYYRQCLDSLLNQTLQANEVVIVHDGYIPDDLLGVEKEFLNKLPLKIVVLKENIGLSLALNKGINHCSNEWIARMDTDDICYPNRFKKQIEYLQNNPKVDFLGSCISEFADNVSMTTCVCRNVPLNHREIKSYSLFKSPINHMSVFYKKSVLQKLDGYKPLLDQEDYLLWIRALQQGYIFANLGDRLVHVRFGKGQISRRHGISYFMNELKLFNYMYNTDYIDVFNYVKAIAVRFVARILPKRVLGFIYLSFARRN